MSDKPIIIVGGSHAGSELAVALRQLGSKQPVTLLTEESYLPYQRPPLSKAWLSDGGEIDAITIRPRASYEAAGIEVVTEARVEAIDRPAKKICLSDGRWLFYSHLALATGARVRRLACAGSSSAESCRNFHYLRTIDDVLPLREQLIPGQRIVVVGGGYIGLELASAAVKRGMAVTVLESLPRVLSRVTAPIVSDFYECAHREAGVDLRTATTVEGFEFNDKKTAVQSVLVRGEADAIERIAADLVVVGVGVVPNIELAEAAGLEVASGIVVDEFARTSDPAILAAGDCTSHPSPYCEGLVRLESVPHAVEQARTAAATICGQRRPHHAVPWFWSDQLDLKLQMVGLSQGHDTVVLRGRPEDRSFAAFYLKAGRIIAVDAINRPKDFMIAKRLVVAKVCASPSQLADESRDLQSLAEFAAEDRR